MWHSIPSNTVVSPQPGLIPQKAFGAFGCEVDNSYQFLLVQSSLASDASEVPSSDFWITAAKVWAICVESAVSRSAPWLFRISGSTVRWFLFSIQSWLPPAYAPFWPQSWGSHLASPPKESPGAFDFGSAAQCHALAADWWAVTGPRVPKVLCLRIQRLIALVTYVFLADLPHRKWANMAITCSSISNWDGGEFSRLWGHLDPYSFGDQGVEVVGIEKHGLIPSGELT